MSAGIATWLAGFDVHRSESVSVFQRSLLATVRATGTQKARAGRRPFRQRSVADLCGLTVVGLDGLAGSRERSEGQSRKPLWLAPLYGSAAEQPVWKAPALHVTPRTSHLLGAIDAVNVVPPGELAHIALQVLPDGLIMGGTGYSIWCDSPCVHTTAEYPKNEAQKGKFVYLGTI